MKYIFKALKHSYLILLFLLIMFPILYTILSSFKTNAELLAYPGNIFPKEFTVDNYIQAWGSKDFPVLRMFFNSVWYTCVSVFITIMISSMTGYVFARGNFPGKNIIFTVFAALMFVSLGTITMYPNFQVIDFLHLSKSLITLLFTRCFGIPIANMYLVRGFIAGIPREIDEAAKIDGCSFFKIYTKIIFPLLTPILATIAMLSFNSSWNEYMGPMIWTMTKPEQRTLIVGIVQLKSTGAVAASWNLMLAGTTITLIPVLVAYAIGNKFFVQGITSGAVKG